ncbi:MAG: asparagine--tRNA ligase [Spirochaetales bacterium]|nr:asparagine--tRNA ligase [Spirochaetales bacterium]
MSEHVLVCNIKDYAGKSVLIKGWVHNQRSSGKISFIQVRDGSGYIQAVANRGDLKEECWNTINEITRESSIMIEGSVSEHPKKKGVFELQVSDVMIIAKSEPFPIEKKEHGPDFLLQNRHLWLRSKKQWAIQRIRNTIICATYDFFMGENFIKVDTPIITASSCEGTTTLFELEYFDLGKAYLSQSGQLYLEALISAHGKVFDFGPVFRAEKSKTRKHLVEFWMMDAEMAFYEHEDNIAIQERLVCSIIRQVLKINQKELEILGRDISKLDSISPPFERITHSEAVKILQKKGSGITEDVDLGANDESLLADVFKGPLFIERWPAKIKAFYMKRCPDDYNYVKASDLMAPEGFGELIGGSQREDDYDLLLSRMKEENMPIDDFQWYLDTRRYGSVPHSGFGYGLERLVTWITGIEHIRETIPFPRMLYRFYP